MCTALGPLIDPGNFWPRLPCRGRFTAFACRNPLSTVTGVAVGLRWCLVFGLVALRCLPRPLPKLPFPRNFWYSFARQFEVLELEPAPGRKNTSISPTPFVRNAAGPRAVLEMARESLQRRAQHCDIRSTAIPLPCVPLLVGCDSGHSSATAPICPPCPASPATYRNNPRGGCRSARVVQATHQDAASAMPWVRRSVANCRARRGWLL